MHNRVSFFILSIGVLPTTRKQRHRHLCRELIGAERRNECKNRRDECDDQHIIKRRNRWREFPKKLGSINKEKFD